MKPKRKRRVAVAAPGKGTKIRPGQVKPFEKATEEVVEARVTIVEALMRTGGILKSQLRATIKREFGVEWRMAEDYIARARERILLRYRQAREEHRADSFMFYEGMTVEKAATIGERLKARQAIDELLGLNAPRRTEVSGPDGDAVPVAVSSVGTILELPAKRKLGEMPERSERPGAA